MGIIRAAVDTARGTLSDQWLDVVEAGDMGEQTLFTEGNIVRQGSNRRGNSDVISNGSVIHVYDNQFMILTDGGKIIDYSAEPGYYTVDNASAPSLFNGDLVGDVLKDSFNRFKFGGGKPVSMKVYFLNLQEIRGIRFGTRNPVNYFDNFYKFRAFPQNARKLFHQDHRSHPFLYGGGSEKCFSSGSGRYQSAVPG